MRSNRRELTLLESHRRREWNLRDNALSITIHVAFFALLISMATQLDQEVHALLPALHAERLVYLKLPRTITSSGSVARVRAEREYKESAPSPEQLQVAIDAMIAQTTMLLEPPPDSSLVPTELSDAGFFSAILSAGGPEGEFSVAAAMRRPRIAVDLSKHSGPFEEGEVETPVEAIDNNPLPRYPAMLRWAGIEGEVLAEFVVDTTGKIERNTLRILSATHALFARAVREALARCRFYPALVGNRAVRMRARQPYTFRLLR